jgi:RNA-splicing ligase RtcB
MKIYKNTKVFTNDIEESAWQQVKEVSDQDFLKDSKIRIMPDCHSGAGCVIGFTATIKDKIVPNLVGVDVGCGMRCVKLAEHFIDYQKLDYVVHQYIPSGFNVRSTEHENIQKVPLFDLNIFDAMNQINWHRIRLSLGTLGGGNHFIEVDRSEQGNYYLVIHSGSRNLGVQVAKYYQKLAIDECQRNQKQINSLIYFLKKNNQDQDIESRILEFKKSHIKPKKELCYVSSTSMRDYLHDMKIAQQFAYLNRKTMADVILKQMGWHETDRFDSVHNYIDLDAMIVRKGATAAYNGQRLIIPLNMRDGSIIAKGKGNTDWNCSAPHGAGRRMSRHQAKNTLSLDEFKSSMRGIYSTSISMQTIDEAPFAYKPSQEIIDLIGNTVKIDRIIKPVYNFKAEI